MISTMILRFLPLFEESLFLSQSLRIRKLTVTWHNDDYIGRKAFRAPLELSTLIPI